jgi:hypothetical protein
VSLASAPARGQLPTTEERLKILTDPESVKAKLEKDKDRPPLEFFRSQVAPFDVLPFIKANHWSTLSLEMRSNEGDYHGILQSGGVRLLGMPRQGLGVFEAPQEVIYRREARLLKEQRARLGLQIMLPQIPKELNVELTRPEAIRVDNLWQATLRTLEPHQMLILLLTKDSTDPYARWNQFQAMIPLSADRGDNMAVDRLRYYRMVLPMDPDQLPLSPHPLTWTTISHVIWDGLPTENLNPAIQQAMLDWLHWGGQLIVLGGAKPSFNALRDSFLGPYLPADPTGENALLSEADLGPLAAAYRPPVPPPDPGEPRPVPYPTETIPALEFYKAPDAIHPGKGRPVFLAGLKAREGASLIALGESSDRVLGVEQRVGRGRVLMLGLHPTDPALAAWPGLDTFVRRVILRRPEEPLLGPGGWNGRTIDAPVFASLNGPGLSWYRLLSRDLGASLPRIRSNEPVVVPAPGEEPPTAPGEQTASTRGPVPVSYGMDASVAGWVDSSALPVMCRDALEEASGISIPSGSFVLKVILAYVIVLVPLNWLICGYILGRRELAWVVVPTLSLAFAMGVERAAAYDMGYDAACDEIDVLETFGEYPRAHLSRFASLYTTGRVQYTISYPNNPTALALPQDNGRSLRGEDITTSTWQSQPIPALDRFQVQPRSLSLFRAEEMLDLQGTISLVTEGGAPRVVNASGLVLRDAVLVDMEGPEDRRETYLGTIEPGATVSWKPAGDRAVSRKAKGELNPEPFLKAFRAHREPGPENQGELRLVAWCDRAMPGQKIEPAVDRQRGFTAVVAHLRMGPPPAPDGPTYNRLAQEHPNRVFPAQVPDEPEPGPNVPGMSAGQGGRWLTPGTPPARRRGPIRRKSMARPPGQ